MDNKPRFGAFSSSVNPDKLAAWVTGALISLASIIAYLLTHLLGLPVLAQQVINTAGPVGAAVGSIWFLFGLLRKGLVTLHQKSQA